MSDVLKFLSFIFMGFATVNFMNDSITKALFLGALAVCLLIAGVEGRRKKDGK